MPRGLANTMAIAIALATHAGIAMDSNAGEASLLFLVFKLANS
jgi:hypothetical protein